MRSRSRLLGVLLPGVLAMSSLGVAACGSSSKSSSTGGGSSGTSSSGSSVSAELAKFPARTAAPANPVKGGTLTVIANGDVDYIDPGAAYYQPTYMVDQAVDSPLMGWPPSDTGAPQPLLAQGQPTITDGGKTVTFKIKPNVRYSPPLGGGPGWSKPVVSADVKYAIERALLPGVPNGYLGLYFTDVVGLSQAQAAVKKDPRKAPNISGIATLDSSTIVFHLSKPSSLGLIGALSLPLSSPIPQGYAANYDSKTPSSTYGQHQLDVGPYYISSYQPGKQITLLRNPNYTAGSDFRPAYLNKVVVQEGFSDTNSAIRKILTGSSMINFDNPPTGESLKLAATQYPKQLTLTPGGANRYIALNTTKPPFNNLNVRKAVIAASNRDALRNTRGGPLAGGLATHFIPPLIPGFQQAGGAAGPSTLDFIQHPTGDVALAESYMKKAGYSSGKCTGNCTVTMAGDNSPPGSNTAQVFKSQLTALGFNVQLHPVEHAVMYTKFCSVVSNAPNACPNVGWIKDFNDGQAIIDVPFNGATIKASPSNNSNWPQLNYSAINAALNSAKYITDPTQRAAQYGKIDDMIMAQAPAVPWLWDYQGNVASTNVIPVINLFNGLTDLSFTSLK
ncbi:MAG: ABC transporter substrate-binding protein [Solirubrobacteraceae bacterium]